MSDNSVVPLRSNPNKNSGGGRVISRRRETVESEGKRALTREKYIGSPAVRTEIDGSPPRGSAIDPVCEADTSARELHLISWKPCLHRPGKWQPRLPAN